MSPPRENLVTFEGVNPWIETIGALLLAGVGVVLGLWFSRQPRWWLGYALPLFVVAIIGIARRIPAIEFSPPICWLMSGRTQFAVAGLLTTMLLTTPLSRLPRARDRRALALLMATFVCFASVSVFLAPAFNRQLLQSLTTRFDGDGICRQNTDYTCGPAAAVTALARLGIKAEEGELAILAHTSSMLGTPPDILASTLNAKYGAEGLKAEYRRFTSATELRSAGLAIAVIKFSWLVDHYVVILEADETGFTVADPFRGKMKLSLVEFADIWRFRAVVLTRSAPLTKPV